jgi:DNA-binding response OmpR family regulator
MVGQLLVYSYKRIDMQREEKLDYSILFIEDEMEIRDNYVRFLKRYYNRVYEASEAESAYKLYSSKKPDILIIDIQLPKMSGLDLLKKIRQEDHTTKAIMLTAFSNKNYLLDASELKLTKYLLKPITRSELKDALSKAIEELQNFKIISNHIIYFRDNFAWETQSYTLFQNSKEIPLTPNERKILKLLFSNINRVFSIDDIIVYVWDSFENDKNIALKTAIKKLRAKLPKGVIENVYAQGYKLVL